MCSVSAGQFAYLQAKRDQEDNACRNASGRHPISGPVGEQTCDGARQAVGEVLERNEAAGGCAAHALAFADMPFARKHDLVPCLVKQFRQRRPVGPRGTHTNAVYLYAFDKCNRITPRDHVSALAEELTPG